MDLLLSACLMTDASLEAWHNFVLNEHQFREVGGLYKQADLHNTLLDAAIFEQNDETEGKETEVKLFFIHLNGICIKGMR